MAPQLPAGHIPRYENLEASMGPFIPALKGTAQRLFQEGFEETA